MTTKESLEKIARAIKGASKNEKKGEVFKRGSGWYLCLRTASCKRYKGKVRISIYSSAKTAKSKKAFENKLEEQLNAIGRVAGWSPITRRPDNGKPSQLSFETFFEGGNDCSQLTDDEIRQIGTRFDSICEKIAIATSSVDGISIESDCHSNVAEKEEQLPCSMATTHEAVDKSSEQREIDKSYWENYYKFWDWFVQEWFKERAKDPNPIKYDDKYNYKELAAAFATSVDELNFDELPTPYLGNPKKGVDAVIINMNPGLSEKIRFREFLGEDSDKTQYFSNRGKPLGWLIDEFENKAKAEYSKFIGIDSEINRSCLNPELLDTKKHPRWVCGVDWWQGYDDKFIVKGVPGKRHADQRMPWIKRIYGKDISPTKVFALELCPYHSKIFHSELDDVLSEFIGKWVIEPAMTAVVQYELPFALAAGRPIADVLDNMITGKKIMAKKIKCWSYKDTIEELKEMEWPDNTKKKPTNRTYCLYSIKAPCGEWGKILVTWASAPGNSAPGGGFEKPEIKIRDYVNSVTLDC